MDAHEYVKQLDTDGMHLLFMLVFRIPNAVAHSGRTWPVKGEFSRVLLLQWAKGLSGRRFHASNVCAWAIQPGTGGCASHQSIRLQYHIRRLWLMELFRSGWRKSMDRRGTVSWAQSIKLHSRMRAKVFWDFTLAKNVSHSFGTRTNLTIVENHVGFCWQYLILSPKFDTPKFHIYNCCTNTGDFNWQSF